MVDKKLSAYVADQRTAGLSDSQIREELRNSGYTGQEVDRALGIVRVEHHLPFSTVVKLLVLALLVSGIFLGVRQCTGEEAVREGVAQTRLLDVTLRLEKNTLEPGESTIVEAEIVNFGTGRYDVELTFQLVAEDGQVVWSSTKTRAVETSLTTAERVTVPLQAPEGIYRLEIIATYGGEQPATAATQMRVSREPEPVERTPVAPARDREILLITSNEQNVDAAVALATAGQVAEAIRSCGEVSNAAEHDGCLSRVAIATQDPNGCTPMRSSEARDSCYMPFILDGAYQYCDKLVSKERKDLCEDLKLIEAAE